ncbi:MAG: hypothetical protein WD598_12895 [Acidimicrobiia bacterium]
MTTIGRRGFLASILGAFVALVTPFGQLVRASASTVAGPFGAGAVVGLFFSDAAAAARIGGAYLAVVPQEGDVNFLLEALTPEGEVTAEWWATVTLEELQQTVRDAAHADFKAEDVADVAGWQLARTEARLAALSTML